MSPALTLAARSVLAPLSCAPLRKSIWRTGGTSMDANTCFPQQQQHKPSHIAGLSRSGRERAPAANSNSVRSAAFR